MKACIKRCDAVMVVQHQPLYKFIAHGRLQLAQSTQVSAAHRGAGFDFNANHTPLLVFNDQVEFVLFFAARL